jgi:hypothetical protein
VTPIFNQRISDPAAWESAGIGAREGLLRRLTSTEIHALP